MSNGVLPEMVLLRMCTIWGLELKTHKITNLNLFLLKNILTL